MTYHPPMVGGDLFVLGVPRTRIGDREQTLPGSQPRLVLARLALAGDQPVTTDQLVELLWPHGAGAHVDGALRGVVSKIRGFLSLLGGAIMLESTGRGYRLTAEPSAGIDIWRARQDVHAVEHSPASLDSHATQAIADRAVGLLAPPLLPGIDGPWLDATRNELFALRRSALRASVVAAAAGDRHDDAIARAQGLLDDDPFDEWAHRAIMSAHAAAGRRSAALQAYATCRRSLGEELGLPPTPETETLYAHLLTSDHAVDRQPPATDRSEPPVRRTTARARAARIAVERGCRRSTTARLPHG